MEVENVVKIVGLLRSYFLRVAEGQKTTVAEHGSKPERGQRSFNATTEPAKRGRIPLSKQYPLKELAEKFLSSSHGGADRSRATVSYEMSTTMSAMKRFVDAGVRQYCRTNGIKVPQNLPSVYTLRRLGLAPDKKTKSASYYKNELPFRRAPRNVNLSKDHPDFHYTAANVLAYAELSALFRDEILMMSVDNKNKIILGAPAIQASRRPVGMFTTDNMPQMPDHSFPEENGKINPSGYMVVSSHLEASIPRNDRLFRMRHDSCRLGGPSIR